MCFVGYNADDLISDESTRPGKTGTAVAQRDYLRDQEGGNSSIWRS